MWIFLFSSGSDSRGICSCDLSSTFSALPDGRDVFFHLLLLTRDFRPSGLQQEGALYSYIGCKSLEKN